MNVVLEGERRVGNLPVSEVVRRMIDEGESASTVARDAGVSRQRISQVVAREEGPATLRETIAVRREAARDEWDARVLAEFNRDPRPAYKIAKALGVSDVSTVSKSLERQGISAKDRRALYAPHPSKAQFDLDHAIDLYKAGRSFEEIGREVGYTTMTVYRHLRDAGVVSRPVGTYSREGKGIKVDLDMVRVTELYESGLSCRDIGLELNRSSTLIYKRLKAAGVPMREPTARKSNWTPERVALAKSRYLEDGLGLREVAHELGVGVTTLRELFIREGVAVRKPGFQGAIDAIKLRYA